MVAISRAGLLRASLASPANFAITSAIEAISVVTAVAGARVESAIISSPAGIASAGEVVTGADTVSRAAVGANLSGAITTLETRVAMANTIIAESSIRAIAGASLDRAVSTAEGGLAVASTVVASSLSRAIVGALQSAAVVTLESGIAIASEVLASAMARAVVGASAG